MPSWASFMDRAELDTFVLTVRAELTRRGAKVSGDPEEGVLSVTAEGREPSQFGLLNLAQMFHQAKPESRDELICSHFERLFSHTPSAQETIDQLAEEFETAKAALKVRLYPSDLAAREMMTTYSPAERILAALVYDLPESVVSVPADHKAKWPLSESELFKAALENVRHEIKPEMETFDVGDGVTIHALVGDSFFVSTQALYLEEFLPKPVSEMGALVAIPHRHMVLFHPIEGESALRALNTLLPMAYGICQEGPGSISPYVYWWREAAWWNEGQFTLLPAEYSGNKIDFHPPNEFVEKILNRLA